MRDVPNVVLGMRCVRMCVRTKKSILVLKPTDTVVRSSHSYH